MALAAIPSMIGEMGSGAMDAAEGLVSKLPGPLAGMAQGALKGAADKSGLSTLTNWLQKGTDATATNAAQGQQLAQTGVAGVSPALTSQPSMMELLTNLAKTWGGMGVQGQAQPTTIPEAIALLNSIPQAPPKRKKQSMTPSPIDTQGE